MKRIIVHSEAELELELQDFIWVVAVAHTSRKPYYWRERLNKQQIKA